MNPSQFYLFFMFLLISSTGVGAQYWQQFVDYKIEVDLNPETAIRLLGSIMIACI